MQSFNLFCPTKITFGAGISEHLPGVLKKNAWINVGLVVDHNLKNQPRIKRLIDLIKSNVQHMETAWCTISEPTYDNLDMARVQFSDPTLQAIIGIGGGSALDMAKAMAVLVHNKKPSIEYRGFDKMTEPVLPIIAVPTTAGTGSEVTPNASFIDSHAKKKLGINGEAVRPKFAFLDPELTLSCPKDPTISAAVDSMVHATEAFAAKKTNQFARFFAAEGFRSVFYTLPKLIDDLENIALRAEVMYGAFLSGVALMHSGTGPAAALSYPLSVHFKVPHGLGGGIFLPKIIEHNIQCGYDQYGELLSSVPAQKSDSSQHFLEELKITWEKLGIPTNLSALGIKPTDTSLIVKETMELKGALDQNPVPFYEEQTRAILGSFFREKTD